MNNRSTKPIENGCGGKQSVENGGSPPLDQMVKEGATFDPGEMVRVKCVSGSGLRVGPVDLLLKWKKGNGEKELVVVKKGTYRVHRVVPEITEEQVASFNRDRGEEFSSLALVVGASESYGADLVLLDRGVEGEHVALARIKGTEELVVCNLSSSNGVKPICEEEGS